MVVIYSYLAILLGYIVCVGKSANFLKVEIERQDLRNVFFYRLARFQNIFQISKYV